VDAIFPVFEMSGFFTNQDFKKKKKAYAAAFNRKKKLLL
jgi:hypothetical protein